MSSLYDSENKTVMQSMLSLLGLYGQQAIVHCRERQGDREDFRYKYVTAVTLKLLGMNNKAYLK